MKRYPILMRPYLKDAIWGGRKLAEKFGKRPGSSLAESWELSDYANAVSYAVNGEYAGVGFDELHHQFAKEAPSVLIKFIDSDADLSIQVHPSVERGDARPKNECWYIISAEQGAKIAYGLNKNLTKEELRAAVEENRLTQELNYINVTSGDFFYVPAGLIHAIGKGITLLEIQQTSDTTYRLYDYGRKDSSGKTRPLHLTEAVEAFRNYNEGEIENLCFTKSVDSEKTEECLAANDYFSVYRLCGEFRVSDYTHSEAAITFLSDGTIYVDGEYFMDSHLAETYYVPPDTACTVKADNVILTSF